MELSISDFCISNPIKILISLIDDVFHEIFVSIDEIVVTKKD